MKTKYFIMLGIFFLIMYTAIKIATRQAIYKTRHEEVITRATELPSLFDIHD